jgi:predicted DNA-binding ribbon-helix-helix protein
VRIDGYVTSVRLENRFWDVLERVARENDVSVSRYLGALHTRIMETEGKIDNFASLLRVLCTLYLDQKCTNETLATTCTSEPVA